MIERNLSRHIAHIPDSLFNFPLSFLRRFAMEDFRRISYFSEESINPFRRIPPRNAIDPHRNLYEIKPFSIGILTDIGIKLRRIHAFRIRFDFYFIQQVFILRDEFADRTRSHEKQSYHQHAD